MAELAQDITPQELSRVAELMAGQVSRWTAVPWFALQYRLSEVGQRRTDPRLLSRVVKGLPWRPQDLAPEKHLHEPRPGIFLNGGLPNGEPESLASRVAEQLEELHAETAVSVSPDAILPEDVSIHRATESVELHGEPPGYERVVLSVA